MKILIDEAPAGPAMDAAVAKALGLTVQWKQWVDKSEPLYFAGTTASRFDDWVEHEDWKLVPSYSAPTAAAWELASNILNGKHLTFEFNHWAVWYFHEFDDMQDFAIGETAPLAICRAFLRANGVEYIEVPE